MTIVDRARTRLGRLPSTVARIARRPYWERPSPEWLVRRWPDLNATCVAAVFFWFSVTPTLVPRPWYLQGVVGGITAVIGYALGAILSTLVRALAWRTPAARVRTRCWQAFFLVVPALTLVLVAASSVAQQRLRALQGLPPDHAWNPPVIVLMAVALGGLLLVVGRAVRLATRALIRGLDRRLPRPVAVASGLLISGVLVTAGLRDVVYERGIVDVAADLAAQADHITKPGVVRPRTPLVSGSAASLVTWDDLGREGRTYIGSVPEPDRIERETGRPAVQPIRVYVSPGGPEAFADAAQEFDDDARLAVRELERTRAFERKVLTIAGTTGSGWVDESLVRPLEYMYGGDTATVSLRYSYFPSWLSYLVDKDKAVRASRALAKAVHERWSALPPDRRPRLLVTGESLGAYAIESSYGSLRRLLAETDGALLAGTPDFSPISSEIRRRRDAGSPVWRPQYQRGRNVRVAQFPDRDLSRPPDEWLRPRVVQLLNASDPVVWWTTDLILRSPEWLEDPLGPDISPLMRWFPVVTFWQVTLDMAMAYEVPAPHGHHYGTNPVEGWAAVAAPDGWTARDTARLKTAMTR
ncbi:alpha/beta hydrolase [Actinomadura hibisca]|uniref:alpha/beta hydrolase n=1 Tax=Actinomadura hibisca TaxID=68565 RepID=UPI00082FB916|nr:alpha/beta-hydrolase family protein [Actinomadura hibisca]